MNIDIQIIQFVLIIFIMVLSFVFEIAAMEVVAFGAVGLLLLFDIISIDEAISGFSNKAVITIGAIFIISHSLVKTGFLEVFVVCFVLNVAAVFTILYIRTESTGVIDTEKSFGANFFQGFDYLYHNTWMLVVLIIAMLHCALTMTYESLTPSIGEEVLILGSSSYTSLMLFAGIGALLGSTAVVTLKTRIGGYLFFFSALLYMSFIFHILTVPFRLIYKFVKSIFN